MTKEEIAILTAEYPETPPWIVERTDLSLKQARKFMQLRRRAFPKTEPSPKQE